MVASRRPVTTAPLIPAVVHAIHVLTGFAFIDAFAGADAEPLDVAPGVVALVKRVANLD